jgi:hypothetical protein
LVEGVQPAPGPIQIRGGVAVAQLLAGDVGGGDLPAGVTDVQSGEQPAVGVRAQMLGPALQHPADAVERIAGAPLVPAGVLLHPAADVVDRLGPPPLSWSTTDHEAPGLSPTSGWSSCRDRGYHVQWRRAA